jgi:trehalose-phosphatase
MVAAARHHLLMLDYDGTIAPFEAERDKAVPLPQSVLLLRKIAAWTRTRVAIVSGRPLEEVEGFLGDLPAIFVGEHGWEQRAPSGEIIRRPLDASVASTIAAAERAARVAGWGDLLERKRFAVVLHTRGLPDGRARECQERCLDIWGQLADSHVALDRIDGGVEMRARGRNKGTVVLSLLSHSLPGTLGVFVGDDVTDEDAFEVVRDWGFGVRVGHHDQPTIAQGSLPSCETLPEFLEEWLRVSESA